MVKGVGGLRKARMRLVGRGKSGSARVLYFWLNKRRTFCFYLIYTKSDIENVPADQLKAIRHEVQRIKKPSAKKIEPVKEISFDARLLLESLRGHADALEGKRKLTMRTTTLNLAKPAPLLRACDIRAIREKLHISQRVFASLLNVPLATARSWEQGTRSPSGAALRLLELVRRSPELVIREVAPSLAKAAAA